LSYRLFLEDGLLNEAAATWPLPIVHVINLGDDVPVVIMLDERVEVRVVGADRVSLHIYAHHCRRWGYCEHVDPRLDVWCSAVFLDKVIEVLDRAAEQLVIREAIHYGVLVEGLSKTGNASDTQTLDIFSDSRNHLFKVLGRHSLDIL
jgi:hypothetical protein